MKLLNALNIAGKGLRTGCLAGVVALAACGGGGDNTGDNPSSGDAGNGVAQTGGTMPASALDSDSSFVAWVKSFASSTAQSGEPVKVARDAQGARATIGADETSEPVRIR